MSRRTNKQHKQTKDMKNQIVLPSINTLLSTDPDKIGAPSLRLALEKQKKAQEEAESQKALNFFNAANNALQAAVDRVRAIRKSEAEALVKVKKLHIALSEFTQDGNCAKLEKVLQEVRGY